MSAWWLLRAGHAPSPARGVDAAPAIVESRDALRARLRRRRPNYTPEWTREDLKDAGIALRELVLEMQDALITRVNRLPEKALTEFLDTAGVSALPGRPASAFVIFEVLDSLTESVPILAGFQVGGTGANGADVYFETNDTLYAAPLKIEAMATMVDGALSLIKPLADPAQAFEPFGMNPSAGAALFIGFSGTAAVRESLTLLFQAAAVDEAPTPVSAGGIEPERILPVPALEWSVLDGGSFVTIEPIRDETAALGSTGLVELRAPVRWCAGDPAGVRRDQPLRWLCVRLIDGIYARAPRLTLVSINAARASAGRTVFGENLVGVPGAQRRQFILSQRPILPGSLSIEVEEGPADDIAADSSGRRFRTWQFVDDLSAAGPDDRVFALDPINGIVYFGDDRHGRSVPEGFGNVRAVKYRVGGSAGEHLAAKAVNTLISAAPGVTNVSNPQTASGGTDPEQQNAALRRGPEEIRARGRAVTVADYALYAKQVRGAEVARAHAVAAYHAQFPGACMPGVVSVFVLPPERDGVVPDADAESLRSVASELTANLASVGVVVVAAVPHFQQVAVRVAVDVNAEVDPTFAVRAVAQALDEYLHPLRGGADGQGWPFGGEIRYDGLVRSVMAAQVNGRPAVRSVRTLDYRVDGRIVVGCSNFAIEPHSLLRAAGHQVVDARNSA
ncbi:putative baseplate assembly protein [Paraburkholderia terrae]